MNYRFETNAIRTDREIKFFKHSTPLYITSSFIFKDAEEMRASLQKKRSEIFIADFQT